MPCRASYLLGGGRGREEEELAARREGESKGEGAEHREELGTHAVQEDERQAGKQSEYHIHAHQLSLNSGGDSGDDGRGEEHESLVHVLLGIENTGHERRGSSEHVGDLPRVDVFDGTLTHLVEHSDRKGDVEEHDGVDQEGVRVRRGDLPRRRFVSLREFKTQGSDLPGPGPQPDGRWPRAAM